MHPGFHAWWRSRGHGHCGEGAHAHEGCSARHGFHGEHGHGAWSAPGFESDPASPFGVRRPLRFLAYKLELNESQVAAFAAILDELKTERAQAAVDQRRRISALADAIESSAFDADKVHGAGEEELKSAERVRSALERALRRMHEALDDERRKKLAYLLRTGVLSI